MKKNFTGICVCAACMFLLAGCEEKDEYASLDLDTFKIQELVNPEKDTDESREVTLVSELSGNEIITVGELLQDTAIYSKADLNASVCGQAGAGESLEVYGSVGEWYMVNYSGRIAYIPSTMFVVETVSSVEDIDTTNTTTSNANRGNVTSGNRNNTTSGNMNNNSTAGTGNGNSDSNEVANPETPIPEPVVPETPDPEPVVPETPVPDEGEDAGNGDSGGGQESDGTETGEADTPPSESEPVTQSIENDI